MYVQPIHVKYNYNDVCMDIKLIQNCHSCEVYTGDSLGE